MTTPKGAVISSSGSPNEPPKAKKSGVLAAVTDLESARSAGKQGAFAAFFGAGATALFAAIAMANPQAMQDIGIDAWAFLDAGLFLGLGIGIWRMSRVCAVLGLTFFLVEKLFMFASNPGNASKGVIMVIILVLAYINGIRGTFAYHRLRNDASALLTADPIRPE
jgi:hypothetical protein